MRTFFLSIFCIFIFSASYAQLNITVNTGGTAAAYSDGGYNVGMSIGYLENNIGGEIAVDYQNMKEYYGSLITESNTYADNSRIDLSTNHEIVMLRAGVVVNVPIFEKIDWTTTPSLVYFNPINISDNYISGDGGTYFNFVAEEIEGALGFGLKTDFTYPVTDFFGIGLQLGFYSGNLSYVMDRRFLDRGTVILEERTVENLYMGTYQANLTFRFSF